MQIRTNPQIHGDSADRQRSAHHPVRPQRGHRKIARKEKRFVSFCGRFSYAWILKRGQQRRTGAEKRRMTLYPGILTVLFGFGVCIFRQTLDGKGGLIGIVLDLVDLKAVFCNLLAAAIAAMERGAIVSGSGSFQNGAGQTVGFFRIHIFQTGFFRAALFVSRRSSSFRRRGRLALDRRSCGF